MSTFLRRRGNIAGAGGFLAEGGSVSALTFGGENFIVHTFAVSGQFVVVRGEAPVNVLTVAGGGTGGGGQATPFTGGGGGAGGWLLNGSGNLLPSTTPLIAGKGVYNISVGGAVGGHTNGQNTSAFGITVTGGGRGGAWWGGAGSGGSGGGAGGMEGGAGSGIGGQGFSGNGAAGAGWGGSGGGAGGGGAGGQGFVAGGPGKAFLGVTYAFGGGTADSGLNGAAGSAGGGAFDGEYQGGGRQGIVVIAYRLTDI